MASETTPADAAATYRLMAWRLIPFLILCYISAFVDRTNISVAKLAFAKDLGLNEAAYGLGGGLFYLGYCLFEVPSNLALARIGARKTIMRIMILWSLFSAAFALITMPWHFYTLRFLLGAAEAGFFPGVLFYLSQWAPAGRRAGFTALFMSAMALSGVIAGPISGAILANMDRVAGLHAWQWVFLIEGAPGILLAIVTYFYLPNTPTEARWLSDAQKALVASDLAAEAASKAKAHSGSLMGALRDPRLWVLAVMAFALISTIGGISLWLPTILKHTGIKSIGTIGLLSAIPYLFAVAAQQIIARRSDRRQERRWHAGACALVAAAGWLTLPFVQADPTLALVVLTVTAMGTFGATGPFWTMPSGMLSGTTAAGGIAIVTTIGGVGGFLSPILVGWLADRSGTLSAGQVYYGAIMAAAAVLLIVTTAPKAK